MSTSPRKQVLVQLNGELLDSIDELSGRTGRNRSDLAREALGDLIRKYRAADIDRQYVEGYTRFPADDEFDAMHEATFREGTDAMHAEDGGW